MISALPLGISNGIEHEHDDRPHVLLVVDQFPKTLGGGERIALKLASLLPQYGFRASILTFSIHPESPSLSRHQSRSIYCHCSAPTISRPFAPPSIFADFSNFKRSRSSRHSLRVPTSGRDL